jgi:hypothetical protein
MNPMVQTRKPKAYILGLAIGTFWLIIASIGAVFSITGNFWNKTNTRTALIVVLVIVVMLLAVSIRHIFAALKLPAEPRSPRLRRIGKLFAVIVALEIVAIGLVSHVCSITGHLSLLVPLELIIIGIHFIPLAKIFGVPRYAVLGLLFCAVSILTLLLVPADAHLGTVTTRCAYSLLGCAASTWLIATGSLLELRHLLP